MTKQGVEICDRCGWISSLAKNRCPKCKLFYGEDYEILIEHAPENSDHITHHEISWLCTKCFAVGVKWVGRAEKIEPICPKCAGHTRISAAGSVKYIW